jgi:L-threonylcarbamoyladenylate synthase
MLLDGGPTAGGLESTVLDLTVAPPCLLRPGLIAPTEIEDVLGPIGRSAANVLPQSGPLPSPGLLTRHYAPRAALECLAHGDRKRVAELARRGCRVGWLPFAVAPAPAPERVTTVVMPAEPAAYAARLFAVLHALDEAGVERVIVALPPDTDAWLAVRDRLRRASASA